jgi:hypothetical protein
MTLASRASYPANLAAQFGIYRLMASGIVLISHAVAIYPFLPVSAAEGLYHGFFLQTLYITEPSPLSHDVFIYITLVLLQDYKVYVDL